MDPEAPGPADDLRTSRRLRGLPPLPVTIPTKKKVSKNPTQSYVEPSTQLTSTNINHNIHNPHNMLAQ